MAINKKLIHFRNKQNFENEVANDNILDTSIVFIQDSKEISTHGTLYKTVNWSVLEEVYAVNGHEYVDLGLPSGLRWAKYNVGATSPEEYGDHFTWGMTTEYTSNSDISNLSISNLQSQGIIDADGNLTAEYDAATANWGSNWRMPTSDEMQELINNCTWKWTTINGVSGYKVIGTNDNSIFLPAAGGSLGTQLYKAGSDGYYWSATPYSNSYNARYLIFSSDNYRCYNTGRSLGSTVRPVINLNL